MGLTKPINSRVNGKQPTGADLPYNPASIVTGSYGPVDSTSGQTLITLPFAVDQSNKANFFLIVGSQILSDGAAYDYTFSAVAPNNTSAQISLNQALAVGLSIRAVYLGVAVPSAAAASLLSLQGQANLATASLAALTKNYLLNGAMDFFQRSGSIVNMGGSLAYQTADRFAIRFAGSFTGTPTSQLNTSVPANNFSKNCILFSGTSVDATAEFTIEQRIEGVTARELAGQTCSFSVQALTSMQTVTIELYVPTAEDNYASSTMVYAATQTVSLGAAYGQVTFNGIAVPSSATAGLAVRIRILNNSITGSTSNHRLTQFMFNIGTAVAVFHRHAPNVQQELSACQRYYEAFGINPFTGAVVESRSDYVGKCTSSTTASFSVYYKTTKRIAATPTWPAASNWQVYISSGTIAASAPIAVGVNGTDHHIAVITVASGLTTNTIMNASLINTAGGSWAVSAEI